MIMVMVMVFNATFNNVSDISWRSVLLVEETGVPGENHRPALNMEQNHSFSFTLCIYHYTILFNLLYLIPEKTSGYRNGKV